MKIKTGLLLTAFVVGIHAPVSALAQGQDNAGNVKGVAQAGKNDDDTLDPNLFVGIEDAYKHTQALRKPTVMPSQIKTLFFTLWQHRLMEEQRRQGVKSGGASQSEMKDTYVPKEQRPRGLRELSLGGILYTGKNDWVVWLNGKRVTPKAIPKEVLDIQVKQSYVELKWYDAYSQVVYPVRLRPHQRFNLDNRIFLPGTGKSTL